MLKQKGVGEAKRFMFVYETGTVIFSGRAHTLQLYLSKQRSTFLPLLDSIAAFMLALMFERQADRKTVSPIVLTNLLALDENQEVSKPLLHN